MIRRMMPARPRGMKDQKLILRRKSKGGEGGAVAVKNTPLPPRFALRGRSGLTTRQADRLIRIIELLEEELSTFLS